MAKLKAFSDEWCREWEKLARASKDFPVYNKDWQGDIGCIMSKDPERNLPEDQYLYMHFDDGKVLSIRMADKETCEKSKFVMSGDYIRWKQVAMGKLDAVKALMQGKLKLKGNLPYVVKYVKGVQEIIRCMIAMDTEFPDD